MESFNTSEGARPKAKNSSPSKSVKVEKTATDKPAVKFPKRKPRSRNKAPAKLGMVAEHESDEAATTINLRIRSKSRIKAELKQLVKAATADKTVVKIPKSSADASSNWKSLTATIPDAKSIKHRNSRGRRGHYQPNHKHEPLPLPLEQPHLPVVEIPKPSVGLNAFGFPTYAADGKCLTAGPLPLKYTRYTRAIAIDCEMVGVGPRNESALARVALVNEEGACIYHKYVKPKLPVSDYRTPVSGIRPEDLIDGADINTVMYEVSGILNGHLLVGHSLANDLKVLFLRHPRHMIRDTMFYFKDGPRPKLSRLISDHFDITIQSGEHNPIEDAQAVMKLYLKFKTEWEKSLKHQPAYPYRAKFY